jgi:hypothetical protein
MRLLNKISVLWPRLIRIAAAFSVAVCVASRAEGAEFNKPTGDSTNVSIAAAIQDGERFLTNLFNPEIDLLPEYQNAKVYWLYHDNYLASKLLNQGHPELAKRIEAALRRFGADHSGKIEILFDPPPDALPFRAYALLDVTNVAGKLIRTERVTDKVLTGWTEYADLLFMAAIANSRTNAAAARESFQRAIAMWDGRGFDDQAARKQKHYATYKLALALIASDRVQLALPQRAQVLAQLRKLRHASGGWVTDYDRESRPRGLANVETTCLTLLALKSSQVSE